MLKNPSDKPSRKQVTVLFCDVADYISRSASMDPEDLADEIRVFQEICTKIIDKYSGNISNFLGDGILAVFGHPYANEFDAEHAVRAGLEMIKEIEQNNTTFEWRKKQPIGIRIGIATSLVVVGEKAGKQRNQDEQIFGEAPNLAARLQAIAESNTVVVSLRTRRLAGDNFKFKDLGDQQLKGFSQPVAAWQLLHESAFQNRNHTSLKRVTTRFVSRKRELSVLSDGYEKAINRDTNIVHIEGEAGIGKSRLLRVFEKTLKKQKIHRIRVSCSPYYKSTPLRVFIDEIYRWIQVAPEDDEPTIQFRIHWALSVLGVEGEFYFALMCDLLSIGLPENIVPLEMSAEEKHLCTIRFLAHTVAILSEQQPVLLIVEDLHWIDPTSLELLRYIIQNCDSHRLLGIFTSRPGFAANWPKSDSLVTIKLDGLDCHESERLVRSVFNSTPLPDNVKENIINKSGGVPLYLEECSWQILNQLGPSDDFEFQSQMFEIPDTLQDSLNARLDMLGKAKDFVQLAAAFGTFFTYSDIKKIASKNNINADAGMDILLQADLLKTLPGKEEDRYVFKHSLFQDAAYQSLLRKNRQKYHLQIAQLFITEAPEMVASQPELVAYHYSQTEQYDIAINLWIKAGRLAITKSAVGEAKDHLYRGLRLLKKLPESRTKKERELKLRLNLAVCLTAQSGYCGAQVKQIYERCVVLTNEVGDAEQQWRAFYGLWRCLICQGQFGKALKFSVKLRKLSRQLDDRMLLMSSVGIQAMTRKFAGKFLSAERLFNESVSCYCPQEDKNIGIRFGQDPCVTIRGLGAVNGLIRNNIKQSEEEVAQSIAVARNSGHPYTIAEVLRIAAMYAQISRNMITLREFAGEAIGISKKYGFGGLLAASNIFMGFSQTVTDHDDASIEVISQNMVAYKEQYGLLFYPYFQGLLAEAHLYLGQYEDAFNEANRALRIIKKRGEVWGKVPILHVRAESAASARLVPQLKIDRWYEEAEALASKQNADLFLQRLRLSRTIQGDSEAKSQHPRATSKTSQPFRGGNLEQHSGQNPSVFQYVVH